MEHPLQIDSDQVYGLLKYGTGEELIDFLQDYPPNDFKEIAIEMAQSGDDLSRLLAIVSLVMSYSTGSDPETGAALALASHQYALELFESGEKNLAKTTITNLGFQYVNALNLLGRSAEVVTFCGQVIPLYKKLQEPENLGSVILALASALLNLKRTDEAEEVLRDTDLKLNWSNRMEYDRLMKKINEIKESITQTATSKNRGDSNSTDGMIDVLNRVVQDLKAQPGRENLISELNKLEAFSSIDPQSPEGHQQLIDILKTGEGYLTNNSNKLNEWTVKRIIREASAIFMHTPTKDQIEASLIELRKGFSWANTNKLSELENDALWGIYLCYSRLNQPSSAADALLLLRNNLEEARKGIKDPLLRGGIFAMYPYLFNALCEKLYSAGRSGELLEAIEASKARGIADILTQKSGDVVADADLNEAVRSIPQLARKENFHYLTYFIDEEKTYASLVDKAGLIHTIEPIVLSRARIAKASTFLDPAEWGEQSDYDPSVIIEDTSIILSPMVAWLEKLFNAGIIEKGDHICYCADEYFFNVPLHYVRFGEGRLIDYVSLSRIQSAFHLKQVLETIPKKYRDYISIIVPAVQDLKNKIWPDFKNNLEKPTLQLIQSGLMGKTLADQSGTINILKTESCRNKLIHFSTHGIFPKNSPRKNPFHDSGLVMAEDGKLPDKAHILSGQLTNVLTPAKVMDLNFDFKGSHITMMACVSGLSQEGLGGDALGLEWAFIQAGASSILSTHWYISAAIAADFLGLFYQEWLVNGQSKTVAHKQTISKIQSRGEDWNNPSFWAAFSLTGDWR